MTTFAEVIERTRRRLLTNMRPALNVLASAINSTDTGLSFTYDFRGGDGSRLSIDLEDMHVVAGASSTSATVIRGMDGSVAAAHVEDSLIRINPPWTNFEIANAINEELDSLSGANLFRIRTVELSYVAATQGYNLATDDFLSVWRVRYRVPGPDLDWPIIDPRNYRIDSAAETDDFASGRAIILHSGGHPGQQVRVSYRASFDRLANMADDVEAVSGLHSQAHHLLDLGAAIRLMSGEDVKRALSIAQANPRRADEVPPSTGARAIESLARQYERDLNREVLRLQRLYPQAIS